MIAELGTRVDEHLEHALPANSFKISETGLHLSDQVESAEPGGRFRVTQGDIATHLADIPELTVPGADLPRDEKVPPALDAGHEVRDRRGGVGELEPELGQTGCNSSAHEILAIEVDGHGVAPADHHADPFPTSGAILSAQQCGERRCPAGLRHDSEPIPERDLCSMNLGIRDQNRLLEDVPN